jgi:hypothetical protein
MKEPENYFLSAPLDKIGFIGLNHFGTFTFSRKVQGFLW